MYRRYFAGVGVGVGVGAGAGAGAGARAGAGIDNLAARLVARLLIRGQRAGLPASPAVEVHAPIPAGSLLVDVIEASKHLRGAVGYQLPLALLVADPLDARLPMSAPSHLDV
jgi:hypothetical protein